jgi:spermidine synthase
MLAVAAAVVALWACAPLPAGAAGSSRKDHSGGPIELDVQSEYSHIRVRKQGNVRSLVFVRDHGEEAIESLINLRKPYELLAPYCRYMFASYLLRPKQEQVLIVGLGGGAMVHFYAHYDDRVRMDVVEIDPAVVQIAEKYFDVRTRSNVSVITDDGLRYLEKTESKYDVIYMDAFLKPSRDTDSTGVPLKMKTIQFYKNVQQKLTPAGVVAFNLNGHRGLQEDLQTIKGAFPQVYAFRVPGGNMVAIGSTAAAREQPVVLRERAAEMDRRFKATFSFQELLKSLVP